MMTRKDYDAMAMILRKHVECKAKTGEFDTYEVVAELAHYFKEENPRFDTNLFMARCGFLTVSDLNNEG